MVKDSAQIHAGPFETSSSAVDYFWASFSFHLILQTPSISMHFLNFS